MRGAKWQQTFRIMPWHLSHESSKYVGDICGRSLIETIILFARIKHISSLLGNFSFRISYIRMVSHLILWVKSHLEVGTCIRILPQQQQISINLILWPLSFQKSQYSEIRNFLVITILFTNVRLFTIYEVNWQISHSNCFNI